MHEELVRVVAGLLAAACGFFASALGLAIVLRGAGSASRPLLRAGVPLLATALAMALATVLSALGAFPYLVPVVLGALCLSSAVVGLAETRTLALRLDRGMLLAAGLLAAGATAATAVLHRTAP